MQDSPVVEQQDFVESRPAVLVTLCMRKRSYKLTLSLDGTCRQRRHDHWVEAEGAVAAEGGSDE
jgi:hypothetical protein